MYFQGVCEVEWLSSWLAEEGILGFNLVLATSISEIGFLLLPSGDITEILFEWLIFPKTTKINCMYCNWMHLIQISLWSCNGNLILLILPFTTILFRQINRLINKWNTIEEWTIINECVIVKQLPDCMRICNAICDYLTRVNAGQTCNIDKRISWRVYFFCSCHVLFI